MRRVRPLRIVLLLLALLALGLASWAFWPVADPALAIHFDLAKTEAARRFLAARDPRPASGLPNVVLIVADDLGRHDVSPYEPASVTTPSLERLAREGVAFSAAYVTTPICSPSRAALMTGRYPQRFGFELLTHDRYPRNRLEWWVAHTFFSKQGWYAIDELRVPTAEDVELQGLPPGEITLAEILKKRGYATGIFGKWHLGVGPQAVPQHRGFDHQYGFYEAFSLYADPDDPDYLGVRDDLFADRYQWWTGRSGNSAIRRDGAVIEEDGYLTDKIADEASAWIRAHAGEPFFAYVPFNAPHAPIQAPRATVERFASEPDPDRRIYLAAIAKLDEAVGRILATLDAAGVADRTLVIFTSDNGAATYTGVATNAPLKGGKLTNFEGGIEVPLIVRWPERLAPRAPYAEPVSTLDLFATIAQAAQAELPADRPYDGVDLVPFLLGTQPGEPHEALYWRAGGHRAVRAGTWKLISDARTGSRVLYDLAQDPYETNDLAEQEPARVDALERALRAWESSLVGPLWPNVMEFRFRDDGHDYVFPL